MKAQYVLVTDFGMVALSEVPPEFPTKKFRGRRYDEFTGKAYYLVEEYPDYDSPLGQKWREYETHIGTLAQAVWEAGGSAAEIESLEIPPFSQWMDRL